MTAPAHLGVILEAMITIAEAAADLVLPLYEGGCDSKIKADGSIVTIADMQGEALITSRLKALFPAIGVLGEESVAAGAQPDLSGSNFCVDPIDGTKQFATGNPEWVIAIGYLELGRPIAGVILAPALNRRLFAGLADHGGFEQMPNGSRHPFTCLSPKSGPIRVVRGGHDTHQSIVSHLDPALQIEMTKVSSALKFGMIAAGDADVFIRAGCVWDWDIAAGQALIEAAGGRVTDLYGQPLSYGQSETGYRHPPFKAVGAGLTV